MFRTKNVGIVVSGARLNRVTVNDEEDQLVVMETNLLIDPWPADLLRELGDDAAAHVFLSDGRIKPELRDVNIRPMRGALQRLLFRIALDGDPVTIEPAVVQWLKFTRREKKSQSPWARGVIRVDLEFRDKAVREFLGTRFGQRVFLTSVALEGRLDFDAPAEETAPPPAAGPRLVAPPADPAAGDVLDEGKGGGRGKKRDDVH
jgi:hypothetical protein